MSNIILDDNTLKVLSGFVDKDYLQNAIELLSDVSDYILSYSQDSTGPQNKKMIDWSIALNDLKHNLQDIKKTQK